MIKMWNMLTIDVEDWYHVSSFDKVIDRTKWDDYESKVVESTYRILKFIEKKGIKATFFCLGYVAERFPELIQEIAEKGHEIATHGYAHRIIYHQSPDKFEKDLEKSLEIIGGIVKEEIIGYRAPSWSITEDNCEWCLDILQRHGIKYDSSIYPIRFRHGIPTINRFPHRIRLINGQSILEIPLPTFRLFRMNYPFGGGLFLRAMPYSLTKRFVNSINRQRQPVVIYIHSWELCPDQPKISVSMKPRFVHYYNLSKVEHILRRLLEDFRFTSVKNFLFQSNIYGYDLVG